MLVDYKQKKFLIIDDFPEFRKSLRFMMRTFGAVEIDDSGSGEDAIELIQRKAYDVILCDYNLGHNRKDGQQVLEEIKHRGLIKLTTVFIMITAENTSDMIMGIVEYQPDDYLIKPFTKESLKARLEKVFKKKADFELVAEAMGKKEYRHAIDICDMYIEQRPPNMFEYIKLKGDLCIQIGDYDKAMSAFEQALSFREIPWARLGIGKVFFYREEHEKARDVFVSLMKNNKMYVAAYDWLSKTLLKLNDYKYAQDVLETAVVVSPKSVVRQKALGEVSLQNKDYDVSERSFKSAISLGKHSVLKSPSAYTGLAKALVNKDESEEAISVLNGIQDEFKGSSEAAFQAAAMKGLVFKKMGNEEEARKSIQEAVGLFDSSSRNIPGDTIIDLAKTCLEMGEKENGLKLIQEVIRNNHDDAAVIETVQAVFNESNLAEEGNKLINSTRREIIQINNDGVKLVDEGKLTEAIERFEKAAANLPGNKIIIANAAQALLMQLQKAGKNEALLRKAKNHLERLQELDSSYKKLAKLLDMYEKLSVS
ncbi:MAG TPA: response regulator [Thermodesulfovibrionales bacterium]|nr:response regulator [Thermodesulfovibrionales bacterium]